MRLVCLDGSFIEEKEIQVGRIVFKQWQIQFQYEDGILYYPHHYYDYHQKTSRPWKNLEVYTIISKDGINKLTLICLNQHCQYSLYELGYLQSITFGRTGDFIFSSPLISFNHFILEKTSLGWYAIDQNSENGLYLNGHRISKSNLQIGDCLFFAGKKIFYLNKYILVENNHETTFKKAKINHLGQRKTKCLKPVFHEEDLYVEIPTFKKTELSKVEEKKNKYDGSSSILIYPLIMLLFNQDFSKIIFLIASICMLLFRKWSHFLNTKMQKQSLKKEKQQRKIMDLLENLYLDYLLEHNYPLLEELCVRYRRNGYYLYRSSQLENFGQVRLGNDRVLFNPFLYKTIAFKYESLHLLAYVFYQWLVYYPIKMIFLVDSLNDLGSLRYVSHLYEQNHLCISFKKEDDASLLEKCHDEHCLIFSKRQVVHENPIIYLNYKTPCDCFIDFNKGIYVDYLKSLTKRFDVMKIDQEYFIYEHFKHQQIQLRKQLKSNHFFDQFPKPFDLPTYYQNSDISECLKVHLGFENDRPLVLDLHNHPHVLIAGMTGSGKSELLNHFILSLAVYYAVEDVNFFLIDFKGGGLSHSFLNLPHVCMTLTNLEREQTNRALFALKDELEKRQEILIDRSAKLGYHLRDIHDLKRSIFKKDFGHLIIIVDEFAELKKAYPDFLSELISISRVGRSLGVHLVLSTQHPSGIVDQQILANMSTRIILRVSSKSDSLELLGSKKATELTRPGEFYLLNQGKMHQGRCALIHEPYNEYQCQAVLYDYKNERYIELDYQSKTNQQTIYEYALAKMTPLLKKAKPLYIQTCPSRVAYTYSANYRKIEIGIYDDYYHRQLSPLIIDGAKGILWIGESEIGTQALIKILRRKHNYCFGDLKGDFIFIEKNEKELIQFLKQLPENSLVIFYKQASKFEMYLDLFPYLTSQRHFTYCFIENNATFLRMRLLQSVEICLVNDNLNDVAIFNKKTAVKVKEPLQFKVQIEQNIYLGCLMEEG